MTPKERNLLAKKLANHRFTIVSLPDKNDTASFEFKVKERVRAKQAEQRVQRAKKIEAQKTKNNGLFVKANVNHPKYKTTLAYKLTQALN